MSDISTLILRFRDLAVSDTIKEHQDIISKEPHYCWWGWWNKPQEELPLQLFAELNKKAKESGLNVFLFDSGNRKTYTAKCVEIYFTTDKSKSIVHPENPHECKNVPQYYRTQEYFAWFKFAEIKENTEFYLDKYSYVGVEDFFVEHKNSFQAFNDKKVCSPDELYSQQRTIWFVREFIKGKDSEIEINLMSERKVSPQNYDDLFTQLDTDSMLWLSDLHFSEKHHAYGRSPIEDDKLSTLIHDQIPDGITPSAIIVSGDLTFKADKGEFDEAEAFLRKIESSYNIDPYNLAVCPGNHDFTFSDNYNIQKTTEKSSRCYREFYRHIFNCEPSQYFSSIRRFLTKSLIPVEIIILNSVSLQQIQVCKKDDSGDNEIVHSFTGLGYVGADQLREVKAKLKKTDSTNSIRVLVIHHHIIPVLETEQPMIDASYSLILDSGSLQNFIFENRISIVFHGHSHKQSYRRISNDKPESVCSIVGLGSTGVKAMELTEGDPNMFGLITFSNNNVVVKKYRVKKKDNTDSLICEHIIPIR